MENPVFDRQHVLEYLRYGLMSAVGYIIFVILFLRNNHYENLYLLYIGNAILMAVMAVYMYTLIGRTYEGKRAVSMLIAGHLALVTGIIMSLMFVAVCTLVAFPDFFSAMPSEKILANAPVNMQINKPFSLALIIMINTILVNAGAGSLAVVIFSYAAKYNQTKDEPASVENQVVSGKRDYLSRFKRDTV